MFSLIVFLTLSEFLVDFERPVLGGIGAKFCKYAVLNTRLKALDELYKIDTPLHRSDFKN